MSVASVMDENWRVVATLLPDGWEQLARETGAVSQRLRGFSSVEGVLRVLLMHVGKGYSLREATVRAKAAGIAEVSDVALLARLRKAEPWLKHLCLQLLLESGVGLSTIKHNVKLRVVDGSVVKEPGKTGSEWRLHFCVSLPNLECDFLSITPTKGEGNGESFVRYPVSAGDYILGDRGYSTPNGIEYIDSKSGFVLVRVNSASLPLFSKSGKRFDLLSAVQTVVEAGASKEWDVSVEGQKKFILGRLCVIRKTEAQISQAEKKLRRNASKQGEKLRPRTLEFAKYVIVFSTFPSEQFSTQEVLECYRLRWQVELIFKRLKTLLGFGHLPKHDEVSSRAWLYGKLLMGLLTEKLARTARAVSPWGYEILRRQMPQSLARI